MKKILTTLCFVLLCACQLYAQNPAAEQLIDQGKKLYDSGKYNDAANMYKKALAKDNNSPRANLEMANAQIALKKYTEAIKYADKVLTTNTDLNGQAYALKGRALDLSQQYDLAIGTYKEGISRYQKDYLLHYNLAATYLNGAQYSRAEEEAKKAIELNHNYPGSHLVLGQATFYQNKRVQALLALYYFLLLEPNTPRSATAVSLIDQVANLGVIKEGDKMNVAVEDSSHDEFNTVDIISSLTQVGQEDVDKPRSKTEQQVFYDNANMLFTKLGEAAADKQDRKDVWWGFYVPFFYTMAQENNVEAFSYQALLSKNNYDIKNWVTDNKVKVDKLSAWQARYNGKD